MKFGKETFVLASLLVLGVLLVEVGIFTFHHKDISSSGFASTLMPPDTPPVEPQVTDDWTEHAVGNLVFYEKGVGKFEYEVDSIKTSDLTLMKMYLMPEVWGTKTGSSAVGGALSPGLKAETVRFIGMKICDWNKLWVCKPSPMTTKDVLDRFDLFQVIEVYVSSPEYPVIIVYTINYNSGSPIVIVPQGAPDVDFAKLRKIIEARKTEEPTTSAPAASAGSSTPPTAPTNPNTQVLAVSVTMTASPVESGSREYIYQWDTDKWINKNTGKVIPTIQIIGWFDNQVTKVIMQDSSEYTFSEAGWKKTGSTDPVSADEIKAVISSRASQETASAGEGPTVTDDKIIIMEVYFEKTVDGKTVQVPVEFSFDGQKWTTNNKDYASIGKDEIIAQITADKGKLANFGNGKYANHVGVNEWLKTGPSVPQKKLTNEDIKNALS